jgi:hypothetical protein
LTSIDPSGLDTRVLTATDPSRDNGAVAATFENFGGGAIVREKLLSVLVDTLESIKNALQLAMIPLVFEVERLQPEEDKYITQPIYQKLSQVSQKNYDRADMFFRGDVCALTLRDLKTIKQKYYAMTAKIESGKITFEYKLDSMVSNPIEAIRNGTKIYVYAGNDYLNDSVFDPRSKVRTMIHEVSHLAGTDDIRGIYFNLDYGDKAKNNLPNEMWVTHGAAAGQLNAASPTHQELMNLADAYTQFVVYEDKYLVMKYTQAYVGGKSLLTFS